MSRLLIQVFRSYKYSDKKVLLPDFKAAGLHILKLKIRSIFTKLLTFEYCKLQVLQGGKVLQFSQINQISQNYSSQIA